MNRCPVVVCDANVLYPAYLRDLPMRLGVSDLGQVHWNGQVHEEWMRNVHADCLDITWEDLEYTRGEMDRALPDAGVEGYRRLIQELSLPDPKDRHVLAAAIHVGADYVVTFNLSDFPEARLDPYGVEAIDPNGLISLLISRTPDRFLEVAAQNRATLRKPSLSSDEYLQALRSGGLKQTADWLEARREAF